MADVFVVHPGDDDGARAARERERLELRERYRRHLVSTAGVDEATAEAVMDALLEHVDAKGRRCVCGCHPRLDPTHDGGFDCPCTWDEARRAEQARKREALWSDPAFDEMRRRHAEQERAIATWLAGQPDVEAKRLTSYAPEQWEGTVDGHSFYFRERHGMWRLELDLAPTGETAERLVEVREDGGMVTEPVPITRGEVIAEGVDRELGVEPVDTLAFIVRTIREHLWGQVCEHAGALFYCPSCGRRMEGPDQIAPDGD